MAKKNKIDVCGHTVEVVEVDGVPRLLVDGVRRSYISGPNGYTLRDAIYEEPAKTLIDAGKALAERLAEMEGK